MQTLLAVGRVIAWLYMAAIVAVLFAFFAASVRATWKPKVRKDAPMGQGEKAPEWFIGSLMHQLADEAEHVVVFTSPHVARARRQRGQKRVAERAEKRRAEP